MISELLAPHVPRAAAAVGIPRTVSGGVALTFDDGPHPEGTPALAAEIARRGHLVALHGFRHRPQPLIGAAAVEDDLARGAAAIERATGARPSLHRPPYGLYSPAGLEAVRRRGLNPLLWSRWGKDWRRLTTPERIAARAGANLRPGDVILLHDADFYSSRGSHRRTAQALRLIVRELKRQKIGTGLPL